MQGWKSQRRETAEEPALHVKRVAVGPSRRAHWLDAMLGSGSRRTVERALALQAPSPRRQEPGRPLRMEAVGGEEPLPRRRKGLIRLALALGVLGWVLAQGRGLLGGVSLVREVKPAKDEAPAPQARIAPAGGKALALWVSGDGQWHFVNGDGGLTRVSREEAQARLDLPHVSGAAVAGQEKRGKVVLRLKVPEGMLSELLPLEDALATEVESVSVGESGARLRTHAGATAELGLGDYRAKQLRLAAVLADLAARKRSAALVDMRFEGSAVVRLASR